jgi:hypothetical protein
VSYIGSTPTTQSFIAGTDSFNGTGSQTDFTLSRLVNSVNDVQVVVNNVVQYPPNYSVSGNTLTISPAPSAGTNNVYVRYLSTTLQSIAPSQGIGIQFGTGSLALPSISFIGDANTGIYSPAADTIAFVEGGVEAVRFDSSGNVGIGTSSPARRLDVRGGLGMQVNEDGSGTKVISMRSDFAGAGPAINVTTNDPLLFLTNNTERARIDTSGNLLVGTTTNTSNAKLILNGATRWAVGPQAGGNLFYVTRDSDNVGVYIVQGATSWTSTSDERAKDIIEPITDAAQKVSSLRAVIGKYKSDEEGVRRAFLIAQDVQTVLPEAVNVQDDEQGTLGLQYTDTIPLLVAAIQEQQAMIDTMKQEIAELKAKVGE